MVMCLGKVVHIVYCEEQVCTCSGTSRRVLILESNGLLGGTLLTTAFSGG